MTTASWSMSLPTSTASELGLPQVCRVDTEFLRRFDRLFDDLLEGCFGGYVQHCSFFDRFLCQLGFACYVLFEIKYRPNPIGRDFDNSNAVREFIFDTVVYGTVIE